MPAADSDLHGENFLGRLVVKSGNFRKLSSMLKIQLFYKVILLECIFFSGKERESQVTRML